MGRAISLKLMCVHHKEKHCFQLSLTHGWSTLALWLYSSVCVCVRACVCMLVSVWEIASMVSQRVWLWEQPYTCINIPPVNGCSQSYIGMFACMSLCLLRTYICVRNYLVFSAVVGLFIACMPFISVPTEVNPPNIFIFIPPTCRWVTVALRQKSESTVESLFHSPHSQRLSVRT